MPFFKNRVFLMLLVLASGEALCADHVIDQRDPKYIEAISHLAQAKQALVLAKAQLEQARRAYPLQGVNTDQMINQLTPIEDTLQVLLFPEEKRLRYETIVPDAPYFIPLNSGDK